MAPPSRKRGGGAMVCCQVRTRYNIAGSFLIGRLCAPEAEACADIVIKPNAADLVLRFEYIVVSVVIIRNVNDNTPFIRAVIGTYDHVLEHAFRHCYDLIQIGAFDLIDALLVQCCRHHGVRGIALSHERFVPLRPLIIIIGDTQNIFLRQPTVFIRFFQRIEIPDRRRILLFRRTARNKYRCNERQPRRNTSQ